MGSSWQVVSFAVEMSLGASGKIWVKRMGSWDWIRD